MQPAFDALLGVVDEVFPITAHAAVMAREGVGRIMSFDAAFDGLPGIARLGG